jgi:hypothetical protein
MVLTHNWYQQILKNKQLADPGIVGHGNYHNLETSESANASCLFSERLRSTGKNASQTDSSIRNLSHIL